MDALSGGYLVSYLLITSTKMTELIGNPLFQWVDECNCLRLEALQPEAST